MRKQRAIEIRHVMYASLNETQLNSTGGNLRIDEGPAQRKQVGEVYLGPVSCNGLYANKQKYQLEKLYIRSNYLLLKSLTAFRANRANNHDINERRVSGTLQKPGPSSTV